MGVYRAAFLRTNDRTRTGSTQIAILISIYTSPESEAMKVMVETKKESVQITWSVGSVHILPRDSVIRVEEGEIAFLCILLNLERKDAEVS